MMKKYIIWFSILAVFNLSALETDQFIANNKILKDSTNVMNQYFVKNIDKALETANNSKSKYSCQEVALEVMKNATGRFSISKASSFASASKEVDRYPEDSVSERGYKDQSFYEHAWVQLQVVDLARTVNINGIHLGTDKFGHFTHMGMNYYKTYLKLISKEMNEEEAIKKSIIKGFGSEYGILGYGIGGVLSYADLEANYQGFMFSLDMCRGDHPILIQNNNQWIQNPNHLFDLKNYFTPMMDESFNLSFWRKPLYKLVREKLIKEYCEVKKDTQYLERINYYKTILHKNLNDQLVSEHILSQKKYQRALENIESFCD